MSRAQARGHFIRWGFLHQKDEAVNVLTEHNAPGVLVANLDDNATIANLLTAPPPAPRGE